MIRWFFVALGAVAVVGASLPGARVVHGRGARRRYRPIRPAERVVVAALGLLWIWFFVRFRAH